LTRRPRAATMRRSIEQGAVPCGTWRISRWVRKRRRSRRGGPAPGINSVIGAATIRYLVEGVEVLGLRDGFEWIMQGNTDHVVPLTIELVSRIHFRGGSFIGISRANPTKDPAHLETASPRCRSSASPS